MSEKPKPTCPFCMSALEITDAGGNPWFECGTTMGFKSSTCCGREPMAVKLREAQERIKRLEEAGDELTESSHSADDDIREHLQVANYNLHGLLNTGERITPPNPPKTVHQAGIDASVRVRERLRAARLAWKAAKEAKP